MESKGGGQHWWKRGFQSQVCHSMPQGQRGLDWMGEKDNYSFTNQNQRARLRRYYIRRHSKIYTFEISFHPRFDMVCQ